MKKTSIASPGPELRRKKATLIDTIINAETILAGKRVTAGFDGFTDTIARIIRKKQTGRPPAFFTSIKQFGEYITEKQAASFSLEIDEKSKKPGGNMPIMANAMGTLGIPVNSIGALGYPKPHDIFKGLSHNCSLYSFAEPGASTAFEFNDGKMFLAQMGALNTTGWEEIKNILGIDKLRELFRQSDLICLLNWSEIDASTAIWKGLLKDVLAYYPRDKEQYIFIDLSDCSKRSSDSVAEALELLGEFAQYGQVILSLNRNEAGILCKQLSGKKNQQDPFKQGTRIFGSLPLYTLLIHAAKETLAFRHDQQVQIPAFYTPSPAISTGAGDNFNAGFCCAQLLQLELELAVLFANATAGWYIRTGTSPGLNDIISFLEKQ